MKSSRFDASLKLSFLSYNVKCYRNDHMLSYDCFSNSLMIKNCQNVKNTRIKNIGLPHIKIVQYYIGTDNDEIEIFDEPGTTKFRLIMSNKSYLRLKRHEIFYKDKLDWYDVIVRPRSTLDLTVFMIYLKDLVNKSTVVEEVDNGDIISKYA